MEMKFGDILQNTFNQLNRINSRLNKVQENLGLLQSIMKSAKIEEPKVKILLPSSQIREPTILNLKPVFTENEQVIELAQPVFSVTEPVDKNSEPAIKLVRHETEFEKEKNPEPLFDTGSTPVTAIPRPAKSTEMMSIRMEDLRHSPFLQHESTTAQFEVPEQAPTMTEQIKFYFKPYKIETNKTKRGRPEQVKNCSLIILRSLLYEWEKELQK